MIQQFFILFYLHIAFDRLLFSGTTLHMQLLEWPKSSIHVALACLTFAMQLFMKVIFK